MKRGRPRSDICSICKERPKAWKTSSYCRECARDERRGRDRSNASRLNERTRAARAKQRAAVLKHYGGRCACCGEIEPSFLALDHIANDGAEERRKGVSIWEIQKHILSGEWADRFQLLCWNCNRGKWACGECPHILRAKGVEPIFIAERVYRRKNKPDLVVP